MYPNLQKKFIVIKPEPLVIRCLSSCHNIAKDLANNNFIDLIPNFKNISSFIQNFNTKRRRRDKKDLAIIGFVTRNRLFR